MRTPLHLTRVCFMMAFPGGLLWPAEGYRCTLLGVQGFAGHRMGKGKPWLITHVASGRRVGPAEGLGGKFRHQAIAAAEAFIRAEAARCGQSQNPASFLRSFLFHFEQGQAETQNAA